MPSDKQPLRKHDEYDLRFSESWSNCWTCYVCYSAIRRRKGLFIGMGGGLLILVVGILVIYFATTSGAPKKDLDPPDPTTKPKPSDSVLGNYREAAVASNGFLCADIGKDILLENGTAVDAAIAVLICEGIMCAQSMGIGGGFLMTIYDRKAEKAVVLNARETAPRFAYEDMYHGNAKLSETGGLAVAVPGELRGYYEAYKRYGGGVPWKRLFEPTIKICEEGFEIQDYVANVLKNSEQDILASPTLSEILVDPNTGHVWPKGHMLKRPQLGETLKIIAEKGVDAFYNGELTDTIISEIQADGGILTKEDLRDYEVEWQEPVEANFGDYKMFSTPLPGSGHLVTFMLHVLQNFVPAQNDGTTYQRIVETFKYGYGKRTELGDIRQSGFVPNITYIQEIIKNLTSESYAEEIRNKITDNKTFLDPTHYGAVFSNEDHGTAHVSVLSASGDAVSATSTVNLIFGSKLRSRKLGIIWNDEMNDFSAPNITNSFGIPPSPANFIKPGKRPLSSMCPSIFIDKNKDVQLVTGAAGGTRITTSTVLVALNNLIFKKNIKEAIDERRFHHQLMPMAIDYEYGFLAQDVKFLRDIGHEITRLDSPKSCVTGIARLNGNITANYDYRRGGSVAGF